MNDVVVSPDKQNRADDIQDEAEQAQNLNLLETIVVFCIACAIIIFVFAISAAGLGNYRFRLPDFLTDSAKTLWSLVTAGGVAVAGSALDLALRRHPRRVNYVTYILATTGVLFVPIIGLLWFGKENQTVAWTVPQGSASLDLSRNVFIKQKFSLSFLQGPSPVGLFIAGEIAFTDGRLSGTAYGQITKPAFQLALPPTVITKAVLHLCYYQRQPGSPIPLVALAPSFPQTSNTGNINIPLPLKQDSVDIPSFTFDIEVPSNLESRETTWLCAYLTTASNQLVAGVR
jgi:hypothetical protein